jgi:hypothetical protein
MPVILKALPGQGIVIRSLACCMLNKKCLVRIQIFCQAWWDISAVPATRKQR